MDSLSAARAQMEISLGFHMLFAASGIGMPLLMGIAEGLHLRTGQARYKTLAQTWSKATALLFVVGAVSGTALSFELGLLWPRFMDFAGASIGPAFALEGYAFFLEAIFIGLYLYGWDRLSPRAHFLCGLVVAFTGLASGVLVVAANSWMQSPAGFSQVVDGHLVDVEALGVFKAPGWARFSIHSSLSCYEAVGFAVAGVYALRALRRDRTAEAVAGLRIALVVASIAAALQPISGDFMARGAAHDQPAKLAAFEAHFNTASHVPLLIGGIPDVEKQTVALGVNIPSGLSLLIGHDPETVVPGLDTVPRDEWPNVVVSHFAFQTMVGAGVALLALAAVYFGVTRGLRRDEPRWLLTCLVLATPLGFLALEAGWVVTEVGRQPWVAYGLLRTRDAVTPAAGVALTFSTFSLLYTILGVVTVVMLRSLKHEHKATGADRGGERHAH